MKKSDVKLATNWGPIHNWRPIHTENSQLHVPVPSSLFFMCKTHETHCLCCMLSKIYIRIRAMYVLKLQLMESGSFFGAVLQHGDLLGEFVHGCAWEWSPHVREWQPSQEICIFPNKVFISSHLSCSPKELIIILYVVVKGEQPLFCIASNNSSALLWCRDLQWESMIDQGVL